MRLDFASRLAAQACTMKKMRGLAILVLVAGCYDPSAQAGAPCSPNGACPESLVCTGGYCLRPGAGLDSHDDGAPSDGDTLDAALDAASDAMMIDATAAGWSTPTAITALNSASKETDPSFTANRLQVYFISNRPNGIGGDDIWYSKRTSLTAAWDVPVNVGALNSSGSEGAPEISPDGSRIWFLSSRTGGGDVYTSANVNGSWTAPVPVTELNTNASEEPAISPDGLTAIIARGALGGRSLLVATRASVSDPFGTLAPIAAINNVATDPASPCLTNGAAVIYFHADATRNIYRSTKVGLGWSAPVPVTELDSSMRDAAPFVTQTDDYMMFERENQIYETTR